MTGVQVFHLIAAFFGFWIFFALIERLLNKWLEWPFPFNLCWPLSCAVFLFFLLLPASNAIQTQIQSEGELKIGMLMAEDFNGADITLISMFGGMFIYHAFVLLGQIYRHGESVMWPYPWEEYGLMGFVLSLKYWVISAILLGAAGYAGHALSARISG